MCIDYCIITTQCTDSIIIYTMCLMRYVYMCLYVKYTYCTNLVTRVVKDLVSFSRVVS